MWNAPSCSALLNIFWADLQPALLSASLSVLHLGRRGLEALEDWLYRWCMNNLREVTDGTDRVSSPVKPWGSHKGPVHHTESYIKGRRRRRPGQGLSYRSPDIWLSSMLQRQPATPVWQLYALHYCALMRSWITVKIYSWYVFLLPISIYLLWIIDTRYTVSYASTQYMRLAASFIAHLSTKCAMCVVFWSTNCNDKIMMKQ